MNLINETYYHILKWTKGGPIHTTTRKNGSSKKHTTNFTQTMPTFNGTCGRLYHKQHCETQYYIRISSTTSFYSR